MANRETFTRRLLDAQSKYSAPIFERHSKELGEAVHNDLFDLEGPREVQRDYSPLDYFMADVFRGFSEIDESFRTLEDIAFYVRRFPFTRTKITKERYLQFHVECYYAESYLLRERLRSYLKVLRRRLKGASAISSLQEACDLLEAIIAKSLEGVTNIRSHHVHQARLNDPAIARMRMVSLLMLAPDPKLKTAMANYHRELHRDAKKKWSQLMKDNNAAIGKLLDHFFGILEPLLFDTKSGAIRLPPRVEA